MTKLPDLDGQKVGYDTLVSVFSRVGNTLLNGWLLALAFGDAHSYAPGIPAFGFWICVFFAFVAAGIASGVIGISLYRIEKRLKSMGRRIR